MIKQTVIVAKKGLINKIELKREDGNLFIPFNVTLGEQENKKTFCILGVHAHDACELREWLECRKDKIKPDIMIGDFNSGNYIKDKEDCKIAINRENYQQLSTGYFDAVQGKYTTTYNTQIDHILIKNSKDFWDSFSVENAKVEDGVKLSDHYPINCEIHCK